MEVFMAKKDSPFTIPTEDEDRKAKELELKMRESQEKIKNIKVEGISGSNSVKVTINGDGERFFNGIELSCGL